MNADAKLSRRELIWLQVIFWSVVFTTLEAPFSLSFNTRLQTWQVWSDVIISIIFASDLIYRIVKRWQKVHKVIPYDRNQNRIWESFKAAGLVAIDVLSCIPFDLIFYVAGFGQGHKIFKLLRIFRLVRIFKATRIFGRVKIDSQKMRVIFYVLGSLFITHAFACLWVALHPVPQGVNIESHYIQSFYWAVSTLTTVGYGDIVPTTNAARILTMAVMLVGAAVYALIIGNISRIFAENAHFRAQNREKWQELEAFMKHYHIPDRLRQSAFSYYNHLYSKHLSDNDARIIAGLPQALKNDLQVYINMKLIRNLPVFRHCSQACLKGVAQALEQKSYAPGTTITRIGEVGEEMFIIGHGIVEVILQDSSVVAVLREGQFFGERALLQHTTRKADVRAQTYCDLYRLNRERFFKIIETYPELAEEMKKITMKRKNDHLAQE